MMGASRALRAHRGRKSTASLVYLYGFALAERGGVGGRAESATPVSLLSQGVEEGVSVERVEDRGVAALVSLVPPATYEQEPFDEHCRDLRWLATRVARHNRVLLQVLAHSAVAPCRFGTLFRGLAAVKEVLARNRRSLAALLRRLEGRAEWSVKAYLAPALMLRRRQEPRANSRELRRNNRARRPGQGATYLLGLVVDRRARREADQRVRNHATAIIGALSRLCVDMTHLPLGKLESDKGAIFLNLACLVNRACTRALACRLRKLAAALRAKGVLLTWSGPWPAYSFVDGKTGDTGAAVVPSSKTRPAATLAKARAAGGKTR